VSLLREYSAKMNVKAEPHGTALDAALSPRRKKRIRRRSG
jgi:hypothetical protein